MTADPIDDTPDPEADLLRGLHAIAKWGHIVPVGTQKRPVGKWGCYVQEKPSAADLQSWWDEGHRAFALLCGTPVPVFCIDVEAAEVEAFQWLRDVVPDVCVVPSPSGGFHVWAIVTDGEQPHTQALAKRHTTGTDGKPESVLLAEVRGMSKDPNKAGAYAVITGHGRTLPEGFSPLGLTAARVDRLLDLIRAVGDPEPEKPPKRPQTSGPFSAPASDTAALIDDLLSRGLIGWEHLLEPGWKRVRDRDGDGLSLWLRPPAGKPSDAAYSAKGCETSIENPSPLLIVWSSSVPWIEVGAELPVTLPAASVLTRARFGGDFRAAMSALEGYAADPGNVPDQMTDWPVEALAAIVEAAPSEPGSADWIPNAWDRHRTDDGDADSAGGDDGDADRAEGDIEAAIFGYSEVMESVRQAARARMVAPLAVLASVLAHVVAEVPPHWTLPPIVGSDASLNLAAGLVGGSGVGKSAAHACARDWMRGVGVARRIGPGSGEGLIQTFLKWDAEEKRMVLIDHPQALLYADEVAQVDAVQTRSGASFGPIVRTMWSGGEVGTQNAEQGRQRHLPAHSYRLCIVAGIQPHLSGVLLDDADAGTPQRWLWIPAADPAIPDVTPDWPTPPGWALPAPPPVQMFTGRAQIEVPAEVAAFVRDEHRKRQRTDGAEGLNGHLILTRLKAAAALALLHGGAAVTVELWDLAGLLIDVSQATRGTCVEALARRTIEERRAQGHGDAQREAGAREARGQQSTRYARLLWRTVTRGAGDGHANMKHESGEGCTRRCLTFALRNNPAADLDHVIEQAEALDWIEARDSRWYPGGSQPAEES